MTLVQKAVKGIFWTYLIYIVQRLLNLVVTMVLARILVPEQFGLVAYALLILSFIDSIKGFGINDALVYTKTDIEESAESAFVINVSIGFLQYAITFLLAPLAVHLIDDPQIVPVLRVIALNFIFDGLGKTHNAMLQKDLLFRQSSVPEIVANIIKGIVSVVLAYLGYGVWSIVYGQVIGTLARSAAKWIALGWIPKFKFYKKAAKALWQYGMHVLAFMVLSIALDQADQL
ncbi:MAG: oligosaccharide flippase family protein, partial [Anaerolineales bacterium]